MQTTVKITPLPLSSVGLEDSAATRTKEDHQCHLFASGQGKLKYAIVFFFSGYAGRPGTLEDGDDGIIFRVDVSQSGAGGILDQLPPQLLDKMANFAETTLYVGGQRLTSAGLITKIVFPFSRQ